MKGCPIVGLSSYRGSYDSSCPIFKILINNISWTTIPECLLQQYANHTNPYYLETILTTKKYEPNSEVLLHTLTTSWAPRYTIDLLLEHRFGVSELDSIIMRFISNFEHYGLSRLISAKVNLLPYQHAIFTFLNTLCQRGPIFASMDIGYYYIRAVLELLINYLTSNPYSATNYMMIQYLRDTGLLGISDIAECIWYHYLNITVGVHSDYINFYQSVIKSLPGMIG
jgi:hypothetical protein